MGYEVDIIGVGQESKSGDAIAIRWGNLFGSRSEQTVVIIDGGFRETGEDVVEHIKKYYRTDSINAVISTHPDQDHINGLAVVLDEFVVGQLWIHKPWEHNYGLASKFADGRVPDFSLGERLRKSLDSASDLGSKAQKKGIHIVEPFSGLSLYGTGELQVLGPSLEYYESLIPEFDGMPAARDPLKSLLAAFTGPVARTIRAFISTWGRDELDDEDTTSAKNNTSVVTQLTVDGHRLLFTGDAGVTALSHAADQISFYSLGTALRFIQIPHHGSRRNVGPTVLNRLIGKPVSQGQSRHIVAIASTAKNGEPKHPRKAVINAFKHRGTKVLATRGNAIRHFYAAPARPGWTAVDPEPYHWTYNDEV